MYVRQENIPLRLTFVCFTVKAYLNFGTLISYPSGWIGDMIRKDQFEGKTERNRGEWTQEKDNTGQQGLQQNHQKLRKDHSPFPVRQETTSRARGFWLTPQGQFSAILQRDEPDFFYRWIQGPSNWLVKGINNVGRNWCPFRWGLAWEWFCCSYAITGEFYPIIPTDGDSALGNTNSILWEHRQPA